MDAQQQIAELREQLRAARYDLDMRGELIAQMEAELFRLKSDIAWLEERNATQESIKVNP